MNVDIFAWYIFSRNSLFLNISENMYMARITYIMPCRGNDMKNTNINPSDIAYFVKAAKM